MATRLYLPATGPAWAAGQPDPLLGSLWDLNEASVTRLPLARHSVGSARTDFVSVADTTTSVVDVQVGPQWVSAPLRAQTISGTFTLIERVLESNAAADMSLQCVIRVVDAGGNEQAVLYGGHNAALNTTFGAEGCEIATTSRSRMIAASLTPYACAAGDRIVLEVGHRSHNTVSTSYTATHRFGDPSTITDFTTGGDSSSDLVPWLEFSQDLKFQSTKLYLPSTAPYVIADIAGRTPTVDHTAASGNAISLTKPTGTVDGDMLIWAISASGTVTTPPAPAGWSVLFAWTLVGTGLYLGVWYKFAASEGASYSLAGLDSARWTSIMRCEQNVDPTTPFDVAVVTGSSTSAQAPSTAVNPIADRTKLIAIESASAASGVTNTGWTATGGSTLDASESSSAAGAANAALATSSLFLDTGGSNTTIGLTPSGTIARGIHATFALRPKSLPVAPAFGAGWGVTAGAFRVPADTTKSDTPITTFTSTAETSATAVNVLLAQFVTGALKAQTIEAGFLDAVVMGLESNLAADMSLQTIVRIVNSSGVHQANLYAGHSVALSALANALGDEFNTAQRSRLVSEVPMDGYTCSAGDRLVVEIGVRAHNLVTTPYTASLRFGDEFSTADFDFTDSVTGSLDPWVDLSMDLQFQNVEARLEALGVEAIMGVTKPEAQLSAAGLEVLMTRTSSVEVWGADV